MVFYFSLVIISNVGSYVISQGAHHKSVAVVLVASTQHEQSIEENDNDTELNSETTVAVQKRDLLHSRK